MQHMEQLKKIRAEAISRLRASDDFKLAVKLGQLIVEMGDTVDGPIDLMGQKSGGGGAAASTSSGSAAAPASSASGSASLAMPAAAAPAKPADKPAAPEAKPSKAGSDDLDPSEIIDELVSEMENDAALSSRDPFSTARSSLSGDAKSANGAKG